MASSYVPLDIASATLRTKVKEFKTGDVVCLRSGGCAMTVLCQLQGEIAQKNGWPPEGAVRCDWLDEHGCHHRETFHVDQIKIY